MRTLLLGLIIGVAILAAFRFVFVPAEAPVHYHANFAVVVGGERLDLSGDRYMAEVVACRAPAGTVHPLERVHLHDNNPDVVHVHHAGATWGHLFANLGLGLGDTFLVTREGEVMVDGEDGRLTFVLNGAPVWSVHNQLIRPGDRLLVSFGPEPREEVVRSHFPRVASDAEEFDRLDDPAACSGPDRPTLRERLRHAFLG